MNQCSPHASDLPPGTEAAFPAEPGRPGLKSSRARPVKPTRPFDGIFKSLPTNLGWKALLSAGLSTAELTVLWRAQKWGDSDGDPFLKLQKAELELLTDIPFGEYVASRADTGQYLGNFYSAIEWLRLMEGEKHLLYFTRKGCN